MTTPALAGLVLDVPALVNLAHRASLYMIALVAHSRDRGHTLAVPAVALAHAAALLDEAGRTELAWAMEMPHAMVVPLLDPINTGQYAVADDIVMGQVHQVALERGWPVVTSASMISAWRVLGIDVLPLP